VSAMHDALVQYVALRRALGTQLQEPAMTLVHSLEFLGTGKPVPRRKNWGVLVKGRARNQK